MIKQVADEYLGQMKALRDKFLDTLKQEYSKFIVELFNEHKVDLMNKIREVSEETATINNSVFIELETIRVACDRQGLLVCRAASRHLNQTGLVTINNNRYHILLELKPTFARLEFMETDQYLSDEKFKTATDLNHAFNVLEHYTYRGITFQVYPNVEVEYIIR
jgi:hypothetical protein